MVATDLLSLIFISARAVGALSYSGTHPAQKAPPFLGFDFDERVVRLRQSTVGRYRRRPNDATTATARSNGGEKRHASKKQVSTLFQYYSPLDIRGKRPCPSNGAGSSAFYRYGNFFPTQREPKRRFPAIRLPPDEAKK